MRLESKASGREPELRPHLENTELREQMEERKSAGLEDDDNPKKIKVLVEELDDLS